MEENGNKPKTPGGLLSVAEAADRGEDVGLEFDTGNRPTGIRAICLVNMAGRPIIRLQVQGTDDQILMDSSQDLEDTLALGAFIVEASAEILEDTAKLLKRSAWRDGIGAHFESYVEKTEAATRRIRKQLSVVEPS